MRNYIFLIGIPIFLAGCASLEAERQSQNIASSARGYASAASCCEGYSSLEFSEWDGKTLKFELGEPTRFFDFESGKSYYSAFQLPENAEGQTLRVKSIISGSSQIAGSTMVPPLVSFLNNEFALLSIAGAMPEKFHMGTFKDSRAGGVAYVSIPRRAEYMVLHADPKFFGQRFQFSRQGGANFVGGVYVPDSNYEFAVPFVPTGKMHIRYAAPSEL